MGTEHQIEFFVREISEADPPRRAAAAKGLGRIGRPEHTAVLIAAARDGDPGVRAAAAIGLGRLLVPAPGERAPRDGRRAVARPVHDLLIELLADPDAQVRRRAALAADRLELTGPAVTAAFGRLLRDEEYHVRLNALVALERLAEPGDVAALVDLLDDPVLAVRNFARVVLRKVLHLGAHNDVLLPRLSQVAASGPGRARAAALSMVAHHGRADLAEAGLTAAEPKVRRVAASILLRDPRPETADRLLAALDVERDPEAAIPLLVFAGRCGERGLAAAVRWLHDHQAGPVAALALGRIGTPEAVRRLRAVVTGRTAVPPVVRGEAACELGTMSDPNDADRLIALLDDPNYDVRHGAVHGLAAMDLDGPRARRQRDRIVEALLSSWVAHPVLSWYYHQALRRHADIRHPEVRARLRRLAEESHGDGRAAALALLADTGTGQDADLFAALLRAPDEDARYEAARMLAHYGRLHKTLPPWVGPEVTDRLTELSRDNARQVRQAAADALRFLDPD
ncbi:hypothetical protein Acsp04_22820 [Actinomadura sp. NBRC 104425]|uniref:HEAT repeat domain-containing protein n=1 Tax=Actinomadura sp. NBRC 104425 TaxID=3032204 RepID=UPI0024A0F661|nr:HEAT repeat domain-containing protein [Actinomadura sp. NBRC 104425]GLZ12047.1 hypothetical protein Acsp04_22820 [Actinomadura sp. NBRC 104425]